MIQNGRQLVTLTTSLKQVLVFFLETKITWSSWSLYVWGKNVLIYMCIYTCIGVRKRCALGVCLFLNKGHCPEVNGLWVLPSDVISSTAGIWVAGKRCDALLSRAGIADLLAHHSWWFVVPGLSVHVNLSVWTQGGYETAAFEFLGVGRFAYTHMYALTK